MRILMISDFYAPALGGVEQHVQGLSESLVRRGHHVAVATLRLDGTAAIETLREVSIYRIRGSAQRIERLFKHPGRQWAPPMPDPGLTWALRRVVAETRPDVVHGHDWLARSFLPLKRWSGAAFVLSLHYYTVTCAKKSLVHFDQICSGPGVTKCLRCAGDHYGFAKGAVVTAGNWLAGAAERASVDHVIAVSEATAIGNGLDGDRVTWEIIPNFVIDADASVEEEQAAYLKQLPEDGFILFVGDVRSAKGVDVLLNAYTGMVDPPPLVLIGKVWPETPATFPPGVRMLGPWPNAAVRAAWGRCLFGVAPSIWPEPFGIVLIEAMASGRPVIASRVGGIPEVVVDGETGILASPGDPVALRTAMSLLVDRPELRERMAAASKRHAEGFRESTVAPRIERVYEMARRQRASSLRPNAPRSA